MSFLFAAAVAGAVVTTDPFVRPVKWLCDEQECEGQPTIAYDYLPAVTSDGRFVATVEERDGWGHTRVPGVRVYDTRTNASVEFYPVLEPGIDLHKDLSKKSEHEARIKAVNAALAGRGFRPLQAFASPPAPSAKWDPLSGCSTRAFQFAGGRRDVGVAVFVSRIVMTGHNCDGVPEQQPWAVRVVRI